MTADYSILSGHAYDLVSRALETVAGNYLEIGVFNGAGFARVARDNPTRICHAVDPFIEDGHTVAISGRSTGEPLSSQHQSTLEHINDLTNARLHVMTSGQFRDQLTAESAQQLAVAVVLIDGNHHYEHVVKDALLAAELIGNKQGVVVFDDIDVPDVARAYNEFMAQHSSCAKQIGTAGGAVSVQLESVP